MSNRKWVSTVANLLETRAMSSVQLERELKPRFRHAPNARTITATLAADKRFRKVGEAQASSLYRAKSHKVKVWGLRGVAYSEVEPYERI